MIIDHCNIALFVIRNLPYLQSRFLFLFICLIPSTMSFLIEYNILTYPNGNSQIPPQYRYNSDFMHSYFNQNSHTLKIITTSQTGGQSS